MPTSRFVVVSAPLEERVTASLVSRAQQGILLALRLRGDVNDTLHREDAGERASTVLSAVIRPGGLPFIVFMLLVAVLAVRELLLRMETRRILKAHAVTNVLALAPSGHQHED